MHWRKPFPPKRPSMLSELSAVVRGAFRPEKVLAPPPELPDELPPAPVHEIAGEPSAAQ